MKKGNLFLGGLIQTPYPCKKPQLYVNGADDEYCSASQFWKKMKAMHGAKISEKPPEEVGGKNGPEESRPRDKYFDY